jgi:bacillopeptidase F (M6 metalloprotease family)
VLPVSQYPQFASHGAAEYQAGGRNPFEPAEGERYAAAAHADASYMRLTKTVDLTSASTAQLQFQLSLNSEQAYDHFIVEAHTVGQDNWTTLPELGGATSTAPPAECTDDGFLLEMHPFLRHYLGGPTCTAAGTTGTWNSITGSTGGWHQVAYDLSGFAGQQVEVSLSYVTDPGTGGVGAFVDDTRIVVDGATTQVDGFEGETSTWTVSPQPEGSSPNAGNWVIGPGQLDFYAATATDDTLLLGFGLEQLATDAERRQLVQQALGNLLG